MYFLRTKVVPLPFEHAFTVLEVLVVIALVAGLTGLALGVGRHAVVAGRKAKALAELAALTSALESYRAREGDYPRTDSPAVLLQSLLGRCGPTGQRRAEVGAAHFESARFLIARPDSPDVFIDPATDPEAVLLDPWSHPYRYAFKSQAPWANSSFVLYSMGPDGGAVTVLLAGGFVDRTAEANEDNLEALIPR